MKKSVLLSLHLLAIISISLHAAETTKPIQAIEETHAIQSRAEKQAKCLLVITCYIDPNLPNHFEAMYALAKIARDDGRIEDAIRWFKQCEQHARMSALPIDELLCLAESHPTHFSDNDLQRYARKFMNSDNYSVLSFKNEKAPEHFNTALRMAKKYFQPYHQATEPLVEPLKSTGVREEYLIFN